MISNGLPGLAGEPTHLSSRSKIRLSTGEEA
jgi:hypothetical protein